MKAIALIVCLWIISGSVFSATATLKFMDRVSLSADIDLSNEDTSNIVAPIYNNLLDYQLGNEAHQGMNQIFEYVGEVKDYYVDLGHLLGGRFKLWPFWDDSLNRAVSLWRLKQKVEIDAALLMLEENKRKSLKKRRVSFDISGVRGAEGVSNIFTTMFNNLFHQKYEDDEEFDRNDRYEITLDLNSGIFFEFDRNEKGEKPVYHVWVVKREMIASYLDKMASFL